jgi:hypothetical protein
MGRFEIGGMEDLPFGKPFSYTEDIPLLSEKRPWWKFWAKKSKPPAAWITQGDEDGEGKRVGQAWLVQKNSEVKVTPIEPEILCPVSQKELDEIIANLPEECNG